MTPLLETQGLSRHFGGVQAVRDVDFVLAAGEIRAIIGPNGAGKTTFVSTVSGRLRPSSGRILFRGRDVTALRAWQRARLGIVYTFQVTSIFANMTCAENLALALQRPAMASLGGLLRAGPATAPEAIRAALDRVGLAEEAGRLAGTLPYGHQRLLEVAMGLALRPQLLIMDEPTQGLSDGEIEAFCKLTWAIAQDLTVLLIEHNMDVVMTLAERITVLDRGAILAEGPPAAIRADPAVQSAYLGSG